MIMKNIVALVFLITFLFSCNTTPERPEPVMTQAQHDLINQESAALQAQKAAQTAAAATSSNVLHYYCADHPSVGGAAQGLCSECNKALVHNQAFHNAPAAGASPVAATGGTGVLHYYCADHPTIGGAAQGTCSECNKALVHNQAFHNTGATDPLNAVTSDPLNSPISVPPTTEPAINAAGIYHYTCPNGHTGGAGSASACGECGTTLVHNTAYHN
jgi:hypothetical protein